jgi:hypothetical protein
MYMDMGFYNLNNNCKSVNSTKFRLEITPITKVLFLDPYNSLGTSSYSFEMTEK